LHPATPEDLARAGEIAFEFLRSSGPGGQNVNKVSTAVRLRFDLRHSRLLSAAVKARLASLAGNRMTVGGELVIEAQRHRTQERNRADALERLGALIARAWRPPAQRRPTRPTTASKHRRLDAKRLRGSLKQGRARPGEAD
jgi:ribosome-associated protein